MSASVIEKPESFHVELGKDDSWIRLSIHLGEEFTGGHVIRLTSDAKFGIDGTDELASSYGETNWLSGVASGVFYAYRTLQTTRRVVYLTEFTGRLGSADMPAVAAAAAIAVAVCLGHDGLPLDLEGWQVKAPRSSENGTNPVSSFAG